MVKDGRDIPEIRGMSLEEERGDLEKHYSKASYAAQYGITLEDAEDVIATTSNHGQAKAAITKMLTTNPDMMKKALFLD